MADIMFNIAKGAIKTYAGNVGTSNQAFVMLLLKSTGLVSDATMKDYDTVADILAGASDECDFTNYARKTITAATVTVDDTDDRAELDIADQTWVDAGGAANNTIGAVILAYDGDTTAGTDANLVPIGKWDAATTTDGTDITVEINAVGFATAT